MAWLHVVAAAVWLGSLVFLAVGVLPVLRRRVASGPYMDLIHDIGMRFRWLGWGLMAVLVGTGLHNLARLGYGWEDLSTGRLWAGPFGRALAWKLGLVALLLVMNAFHDFWLGPRFVRLSRQSSDATRLRRFRQASVWAGRVIVVLTLAVFYLAARLLRGGLG